MGQNESTFMRTYEDTVAQMSSVQLGEIVSRFNELYARAGGPKGHLVDREAFSKYFNVPVAVGDRLFDAFDEKKNGKISFEEFVCGLAVLLHGSFSDKCRLLFQVFNLHEDEGISRAELTTMLSAILQSTNTILYTVAEHDAAVMGGEDRNETVKKMVDAAFKNCDITRTGKLLPMEFEYWVRRNPKILDSLLSFKTNEGKCTLGALLQVPMATTSPGRTRKRQSTTPPSSQREPHPPRVQSVPHFVKMQASPPSLQMTTVTSEPILQPAQKDAPISLQEKEEEGGNSTNRIKDETSHDLAGTEAPPSTKAVAIRDGDSVGSEVKIELPPDVEISSQRSETGDMVDSEELGIEFTAAVRAAEEREEQHDAGIQALSLNQPAAAGEGEQATLKSISLDSSQDFTQDGRGDVAKEEFIVQGGRGRSESGRGRSESGRGLSEEPTASDEIDHNTGSIMQAEEEGLTIDISVVPSASSQLGASSPVLPTSMSVDEEEATAAGELSLPTSLQSEAGEPLSFGGSNELDELEDALTASVSESLPETTMPFTPGADTGESVFDLSISEEVAKLTEGSHDLGGGSHDPGTLESRDRQQPQRHPSPYPEFEGQVSEILQSCWIPSLATQQLLSNAQPTMATEHLSCPGLTADIKSCDPIGEMLANHFPDAVRKPLLSVEHVSMDADGLKRLVEAGCLHAAIDLTGRFLSAHGQGLNMAGQPTMHTHKTLQMWLARIALLVHTGQFRQAETELDSFGSLDNPDLYYQYHTHSYPGKKGSMVPFSLRLLQAYLPACTGGLPAALDRLCLLQGVCEEVLASLAAHSRLPGLAELLSAQDTQIAEALWSERLFRVKCFLGNTFVALQDYSMAVAVYEDILKQQPLLKVEILSGIGRLYLQLGDLATARKYFAQAGNAVREGEVEGSSKSAAILTNEGLVNVFLSKWLAAQECFESALKLDPDSLMLQNNVTVCTFFQGKLKESISQMELLLRSAPPLSLQPAIFMNLAAAYELESGNSLAKKLGFLPLLGQHVGEGFQLQTLNIK